MADLNDSNNDPLPALIPANIPYTVFEVLIGILAMVGNAIVIIVFSRERNLRTVSNFYIIGLALADFLLGLLGVPFSILIAIGLPRNHHICLSAISTLLALCAISIFCLIGVSIDRYWAVLHPLHYSKNSNRKWAMVNIGTCWFLGFVVGFLPLFGWHQDEMPNRCMFDDKIDKKYFVFSCVVSVIIPTTILLIIYAFIYKAVHEQIKRSKQTRINAKMVLRGTSESAAAVQDDAIRELEKRELKATKNLMMIVGFFFICWAPVNICNIIAVIWPDVYDNIIASNIIMEFTILLSHANSAFNPFLYAYNINDFRKHLMKMFRCQ